MAPQSQYTTIRVRLYPTEGQAVLFGKTFGCCRYIWNRMLADAQEFYVAADCHFVPTPAKYKKEAPFLTEVDNQALIQEHGRLCQAFRRFFQNPETFGYPRRKRKKDDKDSFSACNHDFPSGPTIYTTPSGIRMTKAGVVRAKFSRRPQAWWKLRRITVERTPTGKFYCAILYDTRTPAPAAVPPTPETTLGLKFSPRSFFVADDGRVAEAPLSLRRAREKLSRLQQRMSRMQKGSKNYQDALQKYRLLHEHIANARKDFIHKESRRIANAWDAVCMRDEALPALSKLLPAGRAMEGYGMLRDCLRYKLARQGKTLLTVSRFAPVSKTCSVCGAEGRAAEISANTWRCSCGATHIREVNAARNIKKFGLQQYFQMQSA